MDLDSVAISDIIINKLQIDNQDITTKQIIKNNIIKLIEKIKQYATLDIPITINNDGESCALWNNYDNNKYKEKNNQCIIMDNSQGRVCLNNNGAISSCNMYYDDNVINNLNKIDILPLLTETQQKMNTILQLLNQDIKQKNNMLNAIINNIVIKSQLENQQKIFLNNYENSIDDKTNEFEKINKDLEDTNTNFIKNKTTFSNYIKQNNDNEYYSNLYIKIIYALIIIIVILGILNYTFSNVLQ